MQTWSRSPIWQAVMLTMLRLLVAPRKQQLVSAKHHARSMFLSSLDLIILRTQTLVQLQLKSSTLIMERTMWLVALMATSSSLSPVGLTGLYMVVFYRFNCLTGSETTYLWKSLSSTQKLCVPSLITTKLCWVKSQLMLPIQKAPWS